MKSKVLNLDNKAAGDVELNDAIYGLEPRQDLIQRVVVWQLAKRRSGQHKVLTRGEINRTKKKMYKQKGTGQARHGARSAPLFVGGIELRRVVGRCVSLRRVQRKGQDADQELFQHLSTCLISGAERLKLNRSAAALHT